jgi:hypothetical protein
MVNNWLYNHRKDVTSQQGEDGIIEKIFEVLGINIGWCVDIGAGGVHNSNTYNLMRNGWKGVFIDKNYRKLSELKRKYRNSNAIFINAEIGFSSDSLLKGTELPKEFELLSLDIDGNDYYVWQSLKEYTPMVVVIEFNPCIKLNDYVQPFDGKGGASLSMLNKLGKEKGYELISATTINAFFVKRELYSKFGIADNSVKEIFIESNKGYGRDKTDYSK